MPLSVLWCSGALYFIWHIRISLCIVSVIFSYYDVKFSWALGAGSREQPKEDREKFAKLTLPLSVFRTVTPVQSPRFLILFSP